MNKESIGAGEQLVITSNGVPVYHYKNPHLHSFCLCLYLKAGCLFEEQQENGFSHFFEHMVFKNINHLLGGELYRKLDRLGLEFNGCTYKEFMQFEITGAAQHFEEAARILTMIFAPMQLDAEEINTERKRIKQEIRESDELKSLDHFTQEIVWKDTCLANMIGGTFSNLDHFGIKSLREANKTLLSTNNLFFYVTGRFDTPQINHLVHLVEQYDLGVYVPDRKNLAPVPVDFFHRVPKVYVKNSTYYYVRLSFDVDTSRYSEAENTLFYDILFEGESCKIHQELSERTGMVYSFGSQYERYDNLGSLSLYYEVRQADLYESLRRVAAVLQHMKTGLTDEMDFVRPPYVDNAELLFDDVSDFNWTRAYECHIINESYPDLAARKAAYQAVCVDRMTTMANEIFRLSNLVVSLKAPKDKVEEDRIIRIFEEELRDEKRYE